MKYLTDFRKTVETGMDPPRPFIYFIFIRNSKRTRTWPFLLNLALLAQRKFLPRDQQEPGCYTPTTRFCKI